jgi:hypothetical protein
MVTDSTTVVEKEKDKGLRMPGTFPLDCTDCTHTPWSAYVPLFIADDVLKSSLPLYVYVHTQKYTTVLRK